MNSFRSLASAVLAAWVLFCCYSSVVSARKDHNKPHPHRGILKAYTPGPFTDIKLSKKDEDKLASGQPVMKQTLPSKDDPNAGGGAICVQDVDAPKQVVWSQILDLNSYKGKVPKVVTCKNYMEAKTSEGKRMKTKMVVGVLPGYSYESYYDHHYYQDKDSMTWRLDYDKTSDFDDVSGHWHVEKHPKNPNASRVFYACDIKLSGSVPGPILNYISKAALKQATGWVKKESEKQAVTTEMPAPAEAADSFEQAQPKKRSFAFMRQ